MTLHPFSTEDEPTVNVQSHLLRMHFSIKIQSRGHFSNISPEQSSVKKKNLLLVSFYYLAGWCAIQSCKPGFLFIVKHPGFFYIQGEKLAERPDDLMPEQIWSLKLELKRKGHQKSAWGQRKSWVWLQAELLLRQIKTGLMETKKLYFLRLKGLNAKTNKFKHKTHIKNKNLKGFFYKACFQ